MRVSVCALPTNAYGRTLHAFAQLTPAHAANGDMQHTRSYDIRKPLALACISACVGRSMLHMHACMHMHATACRHAYAHRRSYTMRPRRVRCIAPHARIRICIAAYTLEEHQSIHMSKYMSAGMYVVYACAYVGVIDAYRPRSQRPYLRTCPRIQTHARTCPISRARSH
jgi:hypothetical protein